MIAFVSVVASYNVFSMTRKLTVFLLVSFALLYTVLVPSPDFKMEITGELGPKALRYYETKHKTEGVKKYHRVHVNDVLIDVGHVYPAPRKDGPTEHPLSKTRKGKRRRNRRNLPVEVEEALPNVLKEWDVAERGQQHDPASLRSLQQPPKTEDNVGKGPQEHRAALNRHDTLRESLRKQDLLGKDDVNVILQNPAAGGDRKEVKQKGTCMGSTELHNQRHSNNK